LERAEHRSIGAVSIPVASIEDMIQLKIHAGRTQDAADIEHLNRIKARSERGAGPVGAS
jgi:predicted nucleotidyltransferase